MILNNRLATIVTMFEDVKINMFTTNEKNRNSKQRNRNYKK